MHHATSAKPPMNAAVGSGTSRRSRRTTSHLQPTSSRRVFRSANGLRSRLKKRSIAPGPSAERGCRACKSGGCRCLSPISITVRRLDFNLTQPGFNLTQSVEMVSINESGRSMAQKKALVEAQPVVVLTSTFHFPCDSLFLPDSATHHTSPKALPRDFLVRPTRSLEAIAPAWCSTYERGP